MKPRGLGLFPFLLLSLLTRLGCHGFDIPLAGHLQPRDYHSNSSDNGVFGAANATASSHLPLARGNRPVYLVMHVRLTASQTFPPTYEKLFPVYASLHFNATSTDGPLEIQLVNENGQDVIRLTDWGLGNAGKPLGIPQPGYLTDFFELFGRTNATNDQLLNQSTGKGLIYDVWSNHSSLALKAYNSIDFMIACVAKLGLGLAPADDPSAIIPSRIALAQMYWRNIWVAEKVISNYPVWFESLNGWGTEVKKSRAEFNWKTGSDPSSGMVRSRPVPVDQSTPDSGNSPGDNDVSDLAAPGIAETYLANNETLQTAPEFQFIYAQPNDQQRLRQRTLTVIDQYLVYNPGADFPVIGVKLQDKVGQENEYATREGSAIDVEVSGTSAQSSTTLANDVVGPLNRESAAVASRISGNVLTTLARTVWGFSSVIASGAVIVTDFTKHGEDNTIICGVVSIIVLMVGFVAYLGPAGVADFLLLASVFVGEIPDFSKSVESPNMTPLQANRAAGFARSGDTRNSVGGGHGRLKNRAPSAPTPPLRTDVQGILQYTITGDRNQTGNEKCISKGYKNCTVVYGPYLLASALQLEPFDAFALLIHYNEGYPMAMADLVKAFSLATDPDSSKQVATIDCSHSTKPNDRFSWSSKSNLSLDTEHLLIFLQIQILQLSCKSATKLSFPLIVN